MHAPLAFDAYACVMLCKLKMTTDKDNVQALRAVPPGLAVAAPHPPARSSSSSRLQHAPAAAKRSAASTAPSGLPSSPSMLALTRPCQARSRSATTSLCRPGFGAPLRVRRAAAGPPWARLVTGRYRFAQPPHAFTGFHSKCRSASRPAVPSALCNTRQLSPPHLGNT